MTLPEKGYPRTSAERFTITPMTDRSFSATNGALYRHKEIKGLMLDYYEDESFSPWTVDLSFFPDLRILDSNSSLNFDNIQCEKN